MAESFGSDVMLSNLLAFDVKVYDPTVTIQNAVSGSDAVLPGDPGYRNSGVPLATQSGSRWLCRSELPTVPAGYPDSD